MHNSTIHSAELLAAHLASDLLTEEIRALQLLLPHKEFKQINFFLAQDAHSTFLQFLKEPINQYHYRLINKLKTKLQQASDMLNKQIYLIYIKSAELPADVVSRAKNSFFVKKNFYEPLSFTQNLTNHRWASVNSTEVIINKDFKHFNPTIKLEKYGREMVNHINHEAFPLERVGGNWKIPWKTFFNPKSKNALWTLHNCNQDKNWQGQFIEDMLATIRHRNSFSFFLTAMARAYYLANYRKSKFTPAVAMSHTFQYLLRASQKIFPPPKNLKSYIFKNINGIQCVTIKLGYTDYKTNSTKFLPILTWPQLVYMAINDNHTSQIPSTKLSVHFNAKTTFSKITNNPQWPLFVFNLRAKIQHFTNNCAKCKRGLQKYSGSENIHFLDQIKNQALGLFSSISIDFLGYITVKFQRSKKKIQILTIFCNLSENVKLVMVESETTAAVLQGLLYLQSQFSPIFFVRCDKGSSFKNLDTKGYNCITKEEEKLLILLQNCAQSAAKSKESSVAEMVTKKIRFLTRTLIDWETNPLKKDMSFFQWQLCLTHLENVLNSKTYEGTNIAPQDLQGKNTLLPVDLFSQSPYNQLNETLTQIKEFLKIAFKIATQYKMNLPATFHQTFKGEKAPIEENDVALFRPKEGLSREAKPCLI